MPPERRPKPPVRTADGRHVIIDGRRWRSTDPAIPEERRRELVSELMAARRAVGAARRARDAVAEREARDRVHAAKVALGERGPRWWESIERTVLAMAHERGAGRTLCPSEVARALAGDDDFQALMPHVREAAARLADRGELVVTQRGAEVDARTARGPIRLGRPPDDAAAQSADRRPSRPRR